MFLVTTALIKFMWAKISSAFGALMFASFAWTAFRKSVSSLWGENPKGAYGKIPSPPAYPLLGHIPLIGRFPHLSFAELGQKFNGFFELRFGRRRVVVLDRLDAVQEALANGLSFAGRPHVKSFEIFKASGTSYLGVEDATPKWKFLQKAVRRALALVTSTKNAHFQNVIDEGVDSLLKDLADSKNEGFKPGVSIAECSAAIIGSILFGRQFDRRDAFIQQLSHGVKVALDFLQVGSIMDNIPFGTFFFAQKIRNFRESVDPVNQLTAKHIRAHVMLRDQPIDVADALSQTADQTAAKIKQELDISDDTIKFLSQDPFFAGFSAVGESLHWLVNIMAACPRVQKRVQNEIDTVLQGRRVKASDRSRMPYVEAIITENCRFVSLQPLAAPHETMNDVIFRGCHIPARTMVVCNFWAVHHDERVFDRPYEFRPERFLNEDGSTNQTMSRKVIQFGVGKRRCPGADMARQELFLLFTNILQQFTISEPADQPIDIQACEPCLDRKPINYKLVFEARKHPA